MFFINSYSLKIVAIITMLIDHLGAHVFSNNLIMRSIGRLAFPIFAFLITEGYKKTKNVNKYMGRLFIFALISEIFFDLAGHNVLFYWQSQNIYFTLFLGVLSIHLYNTLDKNNHFVLKWISVFLILIVSEFIHADYGYAGVLLIFAYYFTKQYGLFYQALSLGVVYFSRYYVIGGLMNHQIPIMLYGIISAIFILKYKDEYIPLNKYTKIAFYVFYPAHLFVLWVMQIIIK